MSIRRGRLPGAAWWATATVGIAARVLPRGERRARYRREFEAELYGMPRSDQVRHVTGVLSRAWALRAALAESALPKEEDAMTISKLMCRIGLHRWITQRNAENGVAYLECERCRKQKDTMSLADFYGPN